MHVKYLMIREVRALRQLRGHANIIRLSASFTSPSMNYVVLEYFGGESMLKHHLSRIGKSGGQRDSPFSVEHEIVGLQRQIVSAVSHIHSHVSADGILTAHNNISPECIQVHDGVVKLGDFGYSTFGEWSTSLAADLSCKTEAPPLASISSTFGSGWFSPEVLRKRCKLKDRWRGDVFSTGLLLFHTATLGKSHPLGPEEWLGSRNSVLMREATANQKGGPDLSGLDRALPRVSMKLLP